MAGSNINRVTVTGNLTSDPDLRSLSGSGTSVCRLRIAVNGRKRNPNTQQWEDKPNYFDVTVWGAQGENCARFLSKGRPVAVDGRLDWREWQDQSGNKRQSVEIIADTVQFLGSGQGGGDNGGGWNQQSQPAPSFNGGSDVPADTSDFGPPQPVGSPAPTGDDDIPF